MNDIQNITLDVKNNKVYEYIYTKQYDVGRTVVFHITKDGLPWGGSSETRAIFELLKPDGYCKIEDVEYDATNKTVTVILDEQCTAVAGRLPYQITLEEDGIIISTVTGKLICDKAVVQRNEVKSMSSGNLIEDLIDLYDNNVFQARLVVLPANGWENKQQTITVGGVSANEQNQLVIVRPASDYISDYISNGVMCIGQGENELTFSCNTTPLNDLDVYVLTQGIDSRLGNIDWTYSDSEPSKYDVNPNDVWIKAYGVEEAAYTGDDPWIDKVLQKTFAGSGSTWDNNDYKIIMAGSSSYAEETNFVYKARDLYYNPALRRMKFLSDVAEIDILPGEIYMFGRGLDRTRIRMDSITLSNQGYEMNLTHNDIVLTNNTWDGTHTSLKDAIAAGGGGGGGTDNKVSQTPTTLSNDYELLFSYSSNNDQLTEGARKNENLLYNPGGRTLLLAKNFDSSDYSNTMIKPDEIEVLSGTYRSRMQLRCNYGTNHPEFTISVGDCSEHGIWIEDITQPKLTMTNNDLVLGNQDTWDGSHNSLKNTINAIVTVLSNVATVVHISASDYAQLTSEQKADTSKLYLVDEDEEEET